MATLTGPTASRPFPLIGDVQLLVFDLVEGDDLLALRLTNKEVSKSAETAFAKFFFTERHHVVSRRGLQALADISAHPRLIKHLRALHLMLLTPWSGSMEDFHSWREDSRAETHNLLCTILGNLNKHSTGPLHTLTISDGAAGGSPSGGYVFGLGEIFNGVVRRYCFHVVPSLLVALAKTNFKYLNLEVQFDINCGFDDDTGEQIEFFDPATVVCSIEEELLPALGESSKALQSVALVSSQQWTLRDGSFLQRILSAAPNLKKLDILRGHEVDNEVDGIRSLDRTLSGCHLRHLKLEGFRHDSDNSLLTFLKSHRDTLTTIDLCDLRLAAGECWVPILRYITTLPVLEELRFDELRRSDGRQLWSTDEVEDWEAPDFSAEGSSSIREGIDEFLGRKIEYSY